MKKGIYLVGILFLLITLNFVSSTAYPAPFVSETSSNINSISQKSPSCLDYNIPSGESLCIEQTCPGADQSKCYCSKLCGSAVETGNIQSYPPSNMVSGSNVVSTQTVVGKVIDIKDENSAVLENTSDNKLLTNFTENENITLGNLSLIHQENNDLQKQIDDLTKENKLIKDALCKLNFTEWCGIENNSIKEIIAEDKTVLITGAVIETNGNIFGGFLNKMREFFKGAFGKR